MKTAGRFRRYLLLLALGAAAMGLAMLVLLGFAVAQKRELMRAVEQRADSVVALSFQLEREFLRLRSELDHAVSSSAQLDLDALVLRKDVFLSRITLLSDSPSADILRGEREYEGLIPQLQAIAAQAEEAFDDKVQNGASRRKELLERMNVLGPDVQALSLKASSAVARRLEVQDNSLLGQGSLIITLASVQIILLVAAAFAVLSWQRSQEREKKELRRLNQALDEAKQHAEAASQSKSQFLANMSHELRTPFNGFMGMLSLLESTELGLQQKDYVRTAQASAEHLLTLLNDILDMSALQAGKLTLAPEPIDLDAAMHQSLALMVPLAQEKGIGFRAQFPKQALGWVVADVTRLRQIVFNLVSNAIKFTEKGEVCVTLAVLLDNTRDELVLQLVVADTGIGMSAEVLSQLFQRFFRGESGVVRKYGGTGLGLEISQSLARMMGGHISVESKEGQGSSFTCVLQLPRAVVPALVDAAAPHPQSSQVVGSERPGQAAAAASDNELTVGKKVRILVVEDHPVNRKLAGALLKRMGCEVFFCEDGRQAVDTVTHDEFDVILMDVNMPIMDGLTATRLIRELPPPRCNTPIIVFTADVTEGAENRANQAGANDFITKPVQLVGLRAVLQKYVTAPLVG